LRAKNGCKPIETGVTSYEISSNPSHDIGPLAITP
jgi:hypothetical protein